MQCNNTPITKILYLTSTISIVSLINAHSLAVSPSNNSVAQGAIQTLDKTVQILKSSKQETDSIDELLVHSINEINNTITKISNEIPKEQIKAAEEVCKAEIRHAQQTVKQLFNHHKKNLNKNLNVILGKENKNKIIKEAENCITSIQNKTKEADTKVSLDILSEKLTKVEEPLAKALDNMAAEQNKILSTSL